MHQQLFPPWRLSQFLYSDNRNQESLLFQRYERMMPQIAKISSSIWPTCWYWTLGNFLCLRLLWCSFRWSISPWLFRKTAISTLSTTFRTLSSTPRTGRNKWMNNYLPPQKWQLASPTASDTIIAFQTMKELYVRDQYHRLQATLVGELISQEIGEE